MILESMTLENFRVFQGKQKIVFAKDDNRNVTIVHAENGFGKTTLLKALLWGFYGHDGLEGDDVFSKPEELIHEGETIKGIDPEKVYTSVKIIFTQDNKRYSLTRTLTLAQQNIDSKRTLLVLNVEERGQTFNKHNPEITVQNLLVKGISRYVFFNGEHINYLAEEQNADQVKDAIHQMLGLKLLETTIKDLEHQNVLGKFKKNWSANTSEEKKEFVDKLLEMEDELEKEKTGMLEIDNNINFIEKNIRIIQIKLEKNRAASELQQERNEIEKKLRELEENLKGNQTELRNHIAENGYVLLTKNLINKGREIISGLRSQNKIPARVQNDFLSELLEDNNCICGRDLSKGTKERKAVEQRNN